MGIKLPGIGDLANKAMGEKAGEAMGKLADEFEAIEKDLERVIDSNNELKLAIMSTYALLEELAKEHKIVIPTPLIDMKLED